MKFYAFGCECCKGKSPLVYADKKGRESIKTFRSRELAEMEAASFKEPPPIFEFEVKKVRAKRKATRE